MGDSKRDTDVQNRFLDSVGEGEGGMIWENGLGSWIISYMKRITSPGSMHDTGCLGLGHWNDERDGVGRVEGGGSGWGTHAHPGQIHSHVWQNQYNIVSN